MNPHYRHVNLLNLADVLREPVNDETCWSDVIKQIDWGIQDVIEHIFVDFLPRYVSHTGNEQTPCKNGYC